MRENTNAVCEAFDALQHVSTGTVIPLRLPSSDPDRAPTSSELVLAFSTSGAGILVARVVVQKPARGSFLTVTTTRMTQNPSDEWPCAIILTVDYFSDACSVHIRELWRKL